MYNIFPSSFKLIFGSQTHSSSSLPKFSQNSSITWDNVTISITVKLAHLVPDIGGVQAGCEMTKKTRVVCPSAMLLPLSPPQTWSNALSPATPTPGCHRDAAHPAPQTSTTVRHSSISNLVKNITSTIWSGKYTCHFYYHYFTPFL